MSEFELKTNDDYNGPISDLIKVTKACDKAGLDVKNIINVLRRPDKKAVLKEINEYSYRKTEAQRAMEEQLAQEERAKDFGLENNRDNRASLSELREM